MKTKVFAALFIAALTTGCSSIVSKSNYPVVINSVPDAANFEITNRAGQKIQNGKTPATVTLKSSSGYFKGESYTVTVKKDGFKDQVYTLTSSVDGWYFGNILFGGLIGMLIVDPATGAMYNLPERADISLEESEGQEQISSLKIDTIDSLTPEQISELQEIK